MFDRRTTFAALAALLMAATATGCKKKSGTPGPGGPGGWLVGDSGLMTRIDDDGATVGGYDLGTDVALRGIACRGLTDAFVVGDNGTFLRTFDRGDTWDAIDTGVTGDLRAVAADEDGTVVVAGAGPLQVSLDSGDRFTAAGPSRNYVALARHLGAGILALDDTGTVYRMDVGGEPVAVGQFPGARAIAAEHLGQAAIVGTGGVLARSTDGGRTWTAVPADPSLDLAGGWLAADGTLLAVGAGGAVVRMDADGTTVDHPVDGALRAVHIDSVGLGFAAGDHVLAVTHDAGQTWTAVPGDIGAVRSLDQIGAWHL